MQINGYGLRVIHELRGNVHGVCDRRNRRGPVFEPLSSLIRRQSSIRWSEAKSCKQGSGSPEVEDRRPVSVALPKRTKKIPVSSGSSMASTRQMPLSGTGLA
jgi:hypothetical protein